MKQTDSKKVLSFPTHYADQPTISIHSDLWAETVRPTDVRDLRIDKIAALRAAIASGTYHVSATALAGKLIAHMRSDA